MVNFNIGSIPWTVDRSPGQCPICHHAIDARYLTGVVLQAVPMGKARIELIFQCPRAACSHAFIGQYTGEYERSVNGFRLNLRSVTPFSPVPGSHPAEVAGVSPQFVSIFEQAAAGEAFGLKEIAGCGYRKALELAGGNTSPGFNVTTVQGVVNRRAQRLCAN